MIDRKQLSYIVDAESWAKYREKLAAIDKKTAEVIQKYIEEHGSRIGPEFIDYAYAVSTKYGEAAGALAADMYDELADMFIKNYGKDIEPAFVAKTATRWEVQQAVALATPAEIPGQIGKLVRQVSADTMLQNGRRDNAQWAWIPHGGTCPFCITLASNGWRNVRDSDILNRDGHCAHIHPNCDCTVAIRFNDRLTIQGYDPEVYRKQYDAAEGTTSNDKINAMRREDYAKHADEINAQKRAAYAARKELEGDNT